MKTALIALMVLLSTSAFGRDQFQEFAQYTEQQKQWLQEQTIPGQTVSCCSVSDGTQAQEDIRGDRYWISFRACYFPGNYEPSVCHTEGPVEVPPQLVLQGPNRIGPPVVWYGWENFKVKIRCFSPGAGL